MTIDRAILVRCARCNASSGHPCRTPDGAPVSPCHMVRLRLWQAMGCPGPANLPKGRPTHSRPRPKNVGPYRGGPQLQALRRANRKRNRAARKSSARNRRRS